MEGCWFFFGGLFVGFFVRLMNCWTFFFGGCVGGLGCFAFPLLFLCFRVSFYDVFCSFFFFFG